MQPILSKLEVRAGHEVDYPAIVRIQNAGWPLVPISLEELMHEMELVAEDRRSRYLVAELDSDVVGYAEIGFDLGSYHPQRFSLAISVLPELRGKGIGSKLFDQAIAQIEPSNPISIMMRTTDGDEMSFSFARKRLFEVLKRDLESELDLTTLDLKESNTTGLPDGVELLTFPKLDSPEFRREFHDLFELVRKDIPRSSPPVRLEFADFERLVIEEPNFLSEGLVCALGQGMLIGFSGGFRHATPQMYDVWLTAVHPAWRRRGIATVLKVEAARWASQNGFEKIHTAQDTRNQPMLAINERAGFKTVGGMVTLVRLFD